MAFFKLQTDLCSIHGFDGYFLYLENREVEDICLDARQRDDFCSCFLFFNWWTKKYNIRLEGNYQTYDDYVIDFFIHFWAIESNPEITRKAEEIKHIMAQYGNIRFKSDFSDKIHTLTSLCEFFFLTILFKTLFR